MVTCTNTRSCRYENTGGSPLRLLLHFGLERAEEGRRVEEEGEKGLTFFSTCYLLFFFLSLFFSLHISVCLMRLRPFYDHFYDLEQNNPVKPVSGPAHIFPLDWTMRLQW